MSYMETNFQKFTQICNTHCLISNQLKSNQGWENPEIGEFQFTNLQQLANLENTFLKTIASISHRNLGKFIICNPFLTNVPILYLDFLTFSGGTKWEH